MLFKIDFRAELQKKNKSTFFLTSHFITFMMLIFEWHYIVLDVCSRKDFIKQVISAILWSRDHNMTIQYILSIYIFISRSQMIACVSATGTD